MIDSRESYNRNNEESNLHELLFSQKLSTFDCCDIFVSFLGFNFRFGIKNCSLRIPKMHSELHMWLS